MWLRLYGMVALCTPIFKDCDGEIVEIQQLGLRVGQELGVLQKGERENVISLGGTNPS